MTRPREDFEWLAAVIAAHTDHTVHGSTRLQKSILLLQGVGLPTNYLYRLHFYGPYSDELQAAPHTLRSMRLLVDRQEGLPSNYRCSEFTVKPSALLPTLATKVQKAIKRIERESSTTTLELAATYLAFRNRGTDNDEALERLRIKKGRKCTPKNEDAAFDLLRELNLPSPPRG